MQRIIGLQQSHTDSSDSCKCNEDTMNIDWKDWKMQQSVTNQWL